VFRVCPQNGQIRGFGGEFWRIADKAKQPILNNALRIQLSLPMTPHVIADVSLPLIFSHLVAVVEAGSLLLISLSFDRPLQQGPMA
jgi:hypothetical protein